MNHKLDEAQAGIKIVRKNTNNLRYADDNTLMAESEQELKNLLIKMKEEWKSWLKTQRPKNEVHVIWSHHFMKNRWETMEIVRDFIFLVSKITADSDCSHKIKRHLLLGRKAMKNLDSVWKSREITLPTNVLKVKLWSSVLMYKCESWTIKKAECQRIDAF